MKNSRFLTSLSKEHAWKKCEILTVWKSLHPVCCAFWHRCTSEKHPGNGSVSLLWPWRRRRRSGQMCWGRSGEDTVYKNPPKKARSPANPWVTGWAAVSLQILPTNRRALFFLQILCKKFLRESAQKQEVNSSFQNPVFNKLSLHFKEHF